jgi:putative acetyltransferase
VPATNPGLIRPATAADEPAIAQVVTDAFGPAEGPVVARLVRALRSSPAWDPALSFVAEAPSGQVIGYVLATVNLLDAPPRLVRHALAVMQDRPEPLVFLEGSPAYYPRFGFQPAGEKGFRRPSLRIPEPAFMVHPLPAYQPWMTGTLVYADPFWRLDCVGLRAPLPERAGDKDRPARRNGHA